MAKYKVKQGDCLSSIAAAHGYFWKTLFKLPENQDFFREKRENPNVLMPGDFVFIPDKEEKTDGGGTEALHPFRLKNDPAELFLRVVDDDGPWAEEPYTLDIEGCAETYKGRTNGKGEIRHFIPSAAQKGMLIVGEGSRRITFPLKLGSLDPNEEVSGVQERLKNLGYYRGKIDGDLAPKTKSALRAFQRHNKLNVTGELKGDTLSTLKDKHGT